MTLKYKRIILKLSGEALADKNNLDILDANKLKSIASIIKTLVKNKVEVGVVTGAGNIFRGKIASSVGIDPIDGDYMGMIATIINCNALSSVLNNMKVKNIVLSSLEVKGVVKPYDIKKAKSYLKKGYVVLFAGGTGKPRFTTDTCASLRAIEMEADAIIAGKNGVKGIYDSDPKTNKKAKFIKDITYSDVIKQDLKIMDITAIKLLKKSKVVVKIISMEDPKNFLEVVKGKDIGSTIKE